MLHSLIYALIQVVHNFGAVTIVGMAAAGVLHCYSMFHGQRLPAILLAGAWVLQAAAGGAFAATTLWYDGQLPDIHGIAVAALAIKVIATLSGFTLALIFLRHNRRITYRLFWGASFALGSIALVAAAFLRWFS